MSGDNAWQRGEIVEILSENKVKVFCVDEGCSYIRDCNELRVIPQNYTIYKTQVSQLLLILVIQRRQYLLIACSRSIIQAIKISLMYIMPELDGSWKPEAYIALKGILRCDKNIFAVSARKKTANGYNALITINNNVDVSRLLKFKGVVKSPMLVFICVNFFLKKSLIL